MLPFPLLRAELWFLLVLWLSSSNEMICCWEDEDDATYLLVSKSRCEHFISMLLVTLITYAYLEFKIIFPK